MKIPPQYLPIVPYLILNDSQGFLTFAKTVFQASEQYMQKHENGDIRHGELRISDAVVMFSQATETFRMKPAGMFLYVEDVDKTYDLGLRNNAISLMPPSKQDYGYTAGFEDLFGNQWWLVQGEAE